jgi:two-component system chemotaxis response regulator CheB
MRNLVSRIVEDADDLTVAARAMNGVFALQKLERMDIDLILLDLEMPQMSGLEFLEERRKREIDVPVIILSSLAKRGAKITMDALALGASDFILKPSGSISHDIHTVANQIIEMAGHYGRQYRRRRNMELPPDPPETRREAVTTGHPNATTDPEQRTAGAGRTEGRAGERAERRGTPGDAGQDTRRHGSQGGARRGASGAATESGAAGGAQQIVPERSPGSTELIAIGISTGGPNALRKVFAGIDPDLSVPVVVVQHMPEGFTAEFAKSLDRVCPLTVKEAADGMLLERSTVLIAPGNHHMRVERSSRGSRSGGGSSGSGGVVRISADEPRNGHRPSVEVLFESVAEQFGSHAIAVIMTGMGRDGAVALGEVFRQGGITIGQDESTSVVYGMPKVAYELGHVQHQASLPEIATLIAKLAKEKRTS